MKLRLGFVSNSSSSSFTCDICNVTEVGFDMGIREAGMLECKNGHIFCESHSMKWEPTWEEKREILLSYYRVYADKELNHRMKSVKTEEAFDNLCADRNLDYEVAEFELPASACPLCSFGKIGDRDAYLYMLKSTNRTEGELLEELKERFSSYQEMKKWLRSED